MTARKPVRKPVRKVTPKYTVEVLRPNGAVYKTGHPQAGKIEAYIRGARATIRRDRGWTPDFRVRNEFGKDVSSSFRY